MQTDWGVIIAVCIVGFAVGSALLRGLHGILREIGSDISQMSADISDVKSDVSRILTLIEISSAESNEGEVTL